REFRYRVRPRKPAVTEIPRFKFVYFNPRITPPSRGYQTTYADPVPLTVKPRLLAPVEVPPWMLEPPATDDLFGRPRWPWQDWLDRALEKIGLDTQNRSDEVTWPVAVIAMMLPPLTCGIWFIVW